MSERYRGWAPADVYAEGSFISSNSNDIVLEKGRHSVDSTGFTPINAGLTHSTEQGEENSPSALPSPPVGKRKQQSETSEITDWNRPKRNRMIQEYLRPRRSCSHSSMFERAGITHGEELKNKNKNKRCRSTKGSADDSGTVTPVQTRVAVRNSKNVNQRTVSDGMRSTKPSKKTTKAQPNGQNVVSKVHDSYNASSDILGIDSVDQAHETTGSVLPGRNSSRYQGNLSSADGIQISVLAPITSMDVVAASSGTSTIVYEGRNATGNYSSSRTLYSAPWSSEASSRTINRAQSGKLSNDSFNHSMPHRSSQTTERCNEVDHSKKLREAADRRPKDLRDLKSETVESPQVGAMEHSDKRRPSACDPLRTAIHQLALDDGRPDSKGDIDDYADPLGMLTDQDLLQFLGEEGSPLSSPNTSQLHIHKLLQSPTAPPFGSRPSTQASSPNLTTAQDSVTDENFDDSWSVLEDDDIAALDLAASRAKSVEMIELNSGDVGKVCSPNPNELLQNPSTRTPSSSSLASANTRFSSPKPKVKPVVRSPFPKLVKDRSPIIGLSSDVSLRTCFRIGEAINAGTQALREGQAAIIELYAKVQSSFREPRTVKQHFVFIDLFHDRPPYLHGTFEIWKGVEIWDYDSSRFLESSESPRICRCMGKMKREGFSYALTILNIWEASMDDIEYVSGIVH